MVSVKGRLRPRVVTDCSRGGMTIQSAREACDINNIIAQFARTGFSEHIKDDPGQFLDVSSLGGYHDSMIRVQAANNLFMALPSTIRSRFGNDPQRYFDFVSDPKNGAEMVELGLAVARPKAAPTEAEPAKQGPPRPASGGEGAKPPDDSAD